MSARVWVVGKIAKDVSSLRIAPHNAATAREVADLLQGPHSGKWAWLTDLSEDEFAAFVAAEAAAAEEDRLELEWLRYGQ